IDESNVSFFVALTCRFREQWRFLRAANDQCGPGRHGAAKAFQFGAAQLICALDFHATAAAPNRADIERHRVLARAKKNGLGAVDHYPRLLPPAFVDLRISGTSRSAS